MMPDYRTFAARVTELAVAFRRDHDPEHLQTIRSLIDDLGDEATERPTRRRVVYTGWVAPPFRASRRRLRQANPGYDVTVNHPVRAEFGIRGRTRRFGLEVIAEGPIDGPEFKFFVSSRDRDSPLAASNDLARHQLERLGVSADPDAGIAGYVDHIRSSLVPADTAPALWLDALAQDDPSLLWDFQDSEASRGMRARLADQLGTFATNDRWADRYRLAAHGLATSFTSDLAVLPVERPETGREGAVHVAAPALVVSGMRATPVATGRELPAPDTGWLHIDDALLQDGGTVTAGDRFIRYERSADPSLDFVAGQWMTTLGSSQHPDGVLLRRPDVTADRIDEAVLLAGRSDANWFHWMVEYLPRVLMIPASIGGDVPLLVTPRVPATGVEALRELTDRPIVVIDPAVTQPVGRLHVAAPPVEVLDTTKVPWDQGLRVNRAPLDDLRKRWGVHEPRVGTGRRVFVTRHSRHRGITNEHKLARLAQRYGLETVDPSGLDFAAQRRLFSDAEVLVGASGAVMANYLFMRPGSRIVALTSRQLADFILPAVLAEIAGSSFEYLLGTSTVRLTDVPDRNRWIHADFTVSPRDFERALRDLL